MKALTAPTGSLRIKLTNWKSKLKTSLRSYRQQGTTKQRLLIAGAGLLGVLVMAVSIFIIIKQDNPQGLPSPSETNYGSYAKYIQWDGSKWVDTGSNQAETSAVDDSQDFNKAILKAKQRKIYSINRYDTTASTNEDYYDIAVKGDDYFVKYPWDDNSVPTMFKVNGKYYDLHSSDLATSKNRIEGLLLTNLNSSNIDLAPYNSNYTQDFILTSDTPGYDFYESFIRFYGLVSNRNLIQFNTDKHKNCSIIHPQFVLKSSLFDNRSDWNCSFKILSFDGNWDLSQIVFFDRQEIIIAQYYGYSANDFDKKMAEVNHTPQNDCTGTQSNLNNLYISLNCDPKYKVQNWDYSSSLYGYTIELKDENRDKFPDLILNILTVESSLKLNIPYFSKGGEDFGEGSGDITYNDKLVENARQIVIEGKTYNYTVFTETWSNQKDMCAKNKKDCYINTNTYYYLDLSDYYQGLVANFRTFASKDYKNNKLVEETNNEKEIIIEAEKIIKTIKTIQ